jgi:uncharacterized membrane protein YdjX (TVP38/TMEM64 family)
MGDPFVSPAARRRALAALLVGVVALLAASALLRVYAPWTTDPEAVAVRVDSLGAWAPLAFVVLQALQVVVAPIPGQLLAGVAGYLFGTLAGTAYSVLGVAAGSYLVFVLAGRYGRPGVESWLDDGVVDRLDGFVHDGGVPALFLVFLFPAFPDDAVCFLAGLTDLDRRLLVALVVVGRTPSFLVAAAAGGQAAATRWGVLAALLAGGALATSLAYRWRDRLLGLVDG